MSIKSKNKIKRFLGYLCGLLAFAGAIFGGLIGLYLTFNFVFDGTFESIAKIIQHGKMSSKDEIRNLILWIAIVWGSKLLIPFGGLIGMLIGWFPGYWLIGFTEEDTNERR